MRKLRKQIAQNSFRYMRKNSQKNRAILIAFYAQKLRKSSQKKKLRENIANFAQKI